MKPNETREIELCTCIAPKCERLALGMGPSEYCQQNIALKAVLAQAVADGRLEIRGTDAQGHDVYRRTAKPWPGESRASS
jgi:hypothetical protein